MASSHSECAHCGGGTSIIIDYDVKEWFYSASDPEQNLYACFMRRSRIAFHVQLHFPGSIFVTPPANSVWNEERVRRGIRFAIPARPDRVSFLCGVYRSS